MWMHHIIFLFQYCIKIIKLLKTANVDCYKTKIKNNEYWCSVVFHRNALLIYIWLPILPFIVIFTLQSAVQAQKNELWFCLPKDPLQCYLLRLKCLLYYMKKSTIFWAQIGWGLSNLNGSRWLWFLTLHSVDWAFNVPFIVPTSCKYLTTSEVSAQRGSSVYCTSAKI